MLLDWLGLLLEVDGAVGAGAVGTVSGGVVACDVEVDGCCCASGGGRFGGRAGGGGGGNDGGGGGG